MKLGIWPTIVMGQPQIFWGHWRAPHFVGVSPGNQLQKASYSTVGISPTQSRWRHQVPLFIDDDETPHSSQLQAVPLSGTKARTLGQDHSQASSLICNITTVLSMMTISRHWSSEKTVMSCHVIPFIQSPWSLGTIQILVVDQIGTVDFPLVNVQKTMERSTMFNGTSNRSGFWTNQSWENKKPLPIFMAENCQAMSSCNVQGSKMSQHWMATTSLNHKV